MDFVVDGLATGRAVRVLTIVDSFTRECLAIEVDTCLSSRRVTRVLEWILQQRGTPERLRCDNGPEFTSRHFFITRRAAVNPPARWIPGTKKFWMKSSSVPEKFSL